MRTSEADILMVPGWQGSPPDHWQSRWERSLSTARRVEQHDWSTPDRDAWVGAITKAVADSTRPPVLVAHSLGAIAVAHAAPKLPQGTLAGAFLVAPADIGSVAAWPAPADGADWPEAGFGFAPVPLVRLPCPSAVLASTDDPYCPLPSARHFAAAWGAELVEIGPAGHVNAESGHGPWPEGALRFGRFLARLKP